MRTPLNLRMESRELWWREGETRWRSRGCWDETKRDGRWTVPRRNGCSKVRGGGGRIGGGGGGGGDGGAENRRRRGERHSRRRRRRWFSWETKERERREISSRGEVASLKAPFSSPDARQDRGETPADSCPIYDSTRIIHPLLQLLLQQWYNSLNFFPFKDFDARAFAI